MDDSQARQLRQDVGREARRRIVKDAKKHIACEDPRTAAIAIGWAWAVLGPPEQRRPFDSLDFLTPGLSSAFTDVYSG